MKRYLPFIVPAAAAAVSIGLFFGARGIAISLLHRWAKKTETQLDDIVVASIQRPSVFWCIALGLFIGISLSDLPERHLSIINKIIAVIMILSVTIAAANLAGKVFRNYIRKSSLVIPTTGLAYGIVKGTILVVGFLIMLTVLGVSITPLITALGVGGLAVSLALQDTLSNLFSGIHILVEKSIRVGDFVRLETGQEGYVEDIAWRNTRVRMLSNNMVIIPNNKLSQSIVTNYYLPEKTMSLLIPVSVSYSSDPERVEKILVEEAKKAAGDVPGLLPEPEPFVRLIPGFGDSSLEFTLICQVREFVDQYLAQHELRKRILMRFKKEGVEIPLKTLYLREEQS